MSDKCEHRESCQRQFKEDIPIEPVSAFFEYLQTTLKLSPRKAFRIIYYLQELFEWEDENGKHCGIIPDKYEQCRAKGCCNIYNSNSEGCIAIRCDSHTCYKDIECEDCRRYKRLFG